MYLIRNIIIPIEAAQDLKRFTGSKLNISPKRILKLSILRQSIDARKRNHLKFNYTLIAEIEGKVHSHPDILEYQAPEPYLSPLRSCTDPHPFIIGCGPAGLFAALSLVEKGFQPYIFERGDQIENRSKAVNRFWEEGKLDEESNVQFGEGGAGTFSDGKLTARSRDYYSEKVYDYLIRFGADPKIKHEALPHLGTDGLKQIVVNIRHYLEDKGCRFFWRHKLEDIRITNGQVDSVVINGENYHPEILILAIGNAARDTFRMLADKIELQAKPFAVGVRIEHSQDYINQAFYGEKTDLSLTGPANYRLTAKLKDRGVYSFCMCPGGYVVAAASEQNGVVTNGMSYLARDGKFANSAIVASVSPQDFGNEPLAGIKFQQMIEHNCFNRTNPYFAPVQNAADFLKGRLSSGDITNSYQPGTYSADLNTLLPEIISTALKSGLKKFDKRIPGFINNGKLIAPETRTSSPVRLIRERETFNASGISNLYPIGEGAGYAGGIMSSAVDGYKLGEIIYK